MHCIIYSVLMVLLTKLEQYSCSIYSNDSVVML